jgi:hypothetical protein
MKTNPISPMLHQSQAFIKSLQGQLIYKEIDAAELWVWPKWGNLTSLFLHSGWFFTVSLKPIAQIFFQ